MHSRLSSSFWKWPEDGEGLEINTTLDKLRQDIDFIDQIFVRKLKAEAIRISDSMIAVQHTVSQNMRMVRRLENKIRGDTDFNQEDIRDMMSLQELSGVFT